MSEHAEVTRNPKLTWDDNGWPELTCPVDGSKMAWLGDCFWLCYQCKTHRIYGGIRGWINRSIYDRTRGGLVGVAMFAKPATIQTVEPVTGKSVTFIVETARQSVTEGNNQQGDTVFVQALNEDGIVRLALPPKVAATIARQSASLAARARSKAAKRLAKERKERGEVVGVPFVKKAKAS